MKAKKPNNPAQFNLTPMIDCTFQLIIFFILVAQISNEELVPMIVPEPTDSQARNPGEENRARPDVAIVNVWNKYGGKETLDGVPREEDPLGVMKAEGYSLRMQKFDIHDTRSLKEALRQEKARFDARSENENFYLEVRSDMDISYEQILPIMEIAGQVGISRMYMTAVTDPHRNIRISGNGG